MSVDANLEKYKTEKIISFYESQTELQLCEDYLFSKYLSPGLAILDMGVGGGRTTPFLSRNAQYYVGADYSQGMVDVCKKRWPDLDFVHCDASDMSQFEDDQFDVVVFSFNGIDVIRTDEGRQNCLMETARVLKPGGRFIFSSHNARVLGRWPVLAGAKKYQVLWRILYSIFKSLYVLSGALFRKSFRAGEGYLRDPVHGGMEHYSSIPKTMAPQLKSVGLEVVECIGGHYPVVKSKWLAPWFYYSCKKVKNNER